MTRISRSRHQRIKVSIFQHRGVNYCVALDVPAGTAAKFTGQCVTLSQPVRSWRQLRQLYRHILEV